MKNTSIALLTSTNYFQWKSHMEYLLRSKGLYRITLGTETTPTDDEAKVAKWDNKNDEACDSIRMSTFPKLRFHIYGLYSPIEAWEKLHSVFGLKNEI